MKNELQSIVEQFGINEFEVANIENGLINATWLISTPFKKYVFQRINQGVFKNVHAINHNLTAVDDFLKSQNPESSGLSMLRTRLDESLVAYHGAFYRAYDFIEHDKIYKSVPSVQVAFAAAECVGTFTASLQKFDASKLQVTIPNFHDFSFRIQQFDEAVLSKSTRLKDCVAEVETIKEYFHLAETFQQAQKELVQSAIHHDVKVGNILFDNNDKAVALIDYDTLMPGFFISDIGDMMRTYIVSVDEDHKNLSEIEVDEERYQAVIEGYMVQMGKFLKKPALKLLHFSGSYIIAMQALRFLTDFINHDSYYKTNYDDHNLVRAQNQLTLLARYQDLH